MVKPYLSIKLKDPQHYYLEDETIHCILTFRAEKVLKDAIVRVKFIGQATSYANSIKQHSQNIFTAEKEVSISKYNNTSRIKKMNEVEFSMEVPNGVVIPSHQTLEGSDGGKIEYMIEANLETAGFLKRSIQASHIIQIPLVAKVSINENGLERTRESFIQWPKNEENANTCVLSACIPHEGCMRGKPIPVRVEYKQPERYETIKTVTISLIRQEIIASSRDSLPDMTKQLADKVVQKTEKSVELVHEGPSRLLGFSSILVLEIPSNTTPTIHQNAKVMRLDYKIRVTVKIPNVDHDGKDKELSINLPIVIGTIGISNIYDSGFESPVRTNPFGQYQSFNGGSEGSQSIHNGGDGSSGFRSLSPTPHPPFFGNNAPYPPLNTGPPNNGSNSGPNSGFVMPEPFQSYPPMADENRFVLNPQKMPYTSDDNIKIEGMPMPCFDNSQQQLVNEIDNIIYNPLGNNQPAMYPPVLGSMRKNPFRNTIQTELYPPNIINQDTAISPNTISPQSARYGPDHPLNSPADGLASSLSRMSTTTTTSNGSSASHSAGLQPPENVFVHAEKPNTFTPPQTPLVTLETIEKSARPKETMSSYYSGVTLIEESDRSTPPPVTSNSQMATRIDPLLGLTQKDDH